MQFRERSALERLVLKINYEKQLRQRKANVAPVSKYQLYKQK